MKNMADNKKVYVYYPEMGGIYKHYKGGLYKVLTMAEYSESDEPMVVYRSLGFKSIHVRPLSSFNEVVIACGSNSKRVNRFELVS